MNKKMRDLLDKGKEKRFSVVLCVAAVMLLCTLSGCQRHATRGELIDWLQENYTDMPLVAPNTWTFSFAQLYRLLPVLEWETLAGNETAFTFVGADGATYSLSYTLWEDEDGNLVSQCTKDGVPMNISDGCFSSYSLLVDMTGIVLQEESDVTYCGPEDDGITRLPERPNANERVTGGKVLIIISDKCCNGINCYRSLAPQGHSQNEGQVL